MTTLSLNVSAPEFELADHTGQLCRLSELTSQGPVVLFFYPRDETTICTKEACGFRDEHDSFVQLGAQVVGISRDSVRSHAAFAENHRLPFRLLADIGGKVAASFGVKKTLGMMPGRATFVVDTRGKVRLNFSSPLSAQAHVDHALAAVKQLTGAGRPT